MSCILIADSGSTKTAWCLSDVNGLEKAFTTSGINPSVMDGQSVVKVLSDELLTNVGDASMVDKVLFYGAGCSSHYAHIVVDALKDLGFSNADIVVESDMLGAAIAACGHEPGIVGILGTGSNSCVYDGKKILANTPSLGFILGDEGGGAYIGKRLVGDCLKGVMPEKICRLFEEETGLTVAEVIRRVYREASPNRFLASLTTFCSRHVDEPEVEILLVDCFEEFFRRNILPYGMMNVRVHLVGSIAAVFEEQVMMAASKCSLEVGKVLRSPIEGLTEYYLR